MKNESAYTKSWAALLKKVKDAHQAPEPIACDPVTQLVLAYLQWNSTRKLALAAHEKLMKQVVDNNDLRVSHPYELIQAIGEDYPHAEERAARLHEALQEIFVREHMVSLDAVLAQGKKQAKAYLENIPGMVSYVANRVMLLSAGAHVMPVDDVLRARLIGEEVVDSEASNEEIAAFLERQIKAGEAVQVHLLLEEWSTAGGIKRALAAVEKVPVSRPPAPKVVAEKPADDKTAEKSDAKPLSGKSAESKTNPKTTPKSTSKTTKKSTKPDK